MDTTKKFEHPSIKDLIKLIDVETQKIKDAEIQKEKEAKEELERLRQKVKIDSKYFSEQIAWMKAQNKSELPVSISNLCHKDPSRFVRVFIETFNDQYGEFFKLEVIPGYKIQNLSIVLNLIIVNPNF